MADELNFVKEAFDFSNKSVRVIQDLFGPNGLDCMVSTISGTILVTNNGFDVIKSLSCQSPIGQLLFKGLQAFYNCTGDFSEKYLLLTRELLCEVLRVIEDEQEGPKQQLLCISNGMKFVLMDILPKLLGGVKTLGHITEGAPECIERDVTAVIRTNINGHFSPKTCDELTNLLKNLLFESSGTVDAIILKSRVENLVYNFSDVFLEVPGLPVSSLAVLSGIVIPRGFCTMVQGLPSLPSDKPFKFILSGSSFGYDLPQSQTVLELKNSQRMEVFTEWRTQYIENIIQKFSCIGIKLIISSEPLPETIIHFCNQHEIAAIQLVPKEDIRRLCNIFNINCMFEVEDDLSSFIGKASCCKPVQVGQHTYVYLKPSGVCGQLLTKQVLLYGSCGAMCRQYSVALKNALKSVKNSFNKTKDGTQMLSVVPGGGVFEVGLSFELERYRKENKVEPNVEAACCILEKALFSIPRQLHENFGKQLSFCSYTAQMKEVMMVGKQITGLNEDGILCDLCEAGVLEPLLANNQLVSAVLQLFIQLTRTDQIVHVKKLPNNDTTDG